MAFSHSHAKKTLIAIIITIYIVFSINHAEAKHHHHRHDEYGDDEDFNIVWRRNVSLPNPPKGLDYTFYDNTCPDAEEIVRARVTFFVGQDPSIAPGLLRLFYHDCFIHGCDASVLLHGSVGGPWDGFSPPHLSLNPQVFRVIDDIKSFLEARCPGVVSCADVIALAARDAVLAAKGPYFPIMTGRRDGFEIDTAVQVLSDLPKPTWRVSQLLSSFKSRGLDVVDLVALSGAHTIGKAHCASFMNRMAPKDDTMAEDIEETIKATCPTFSFNNTTYLDQTTPMQFDNKYFKNLIKRKALLTSDDTLFHDFRTKELVKLFEQTRFLFYVQFGASMIRMGQIGVLTGSQGEIRLNCFMRNPLPPLPSPAPAPVPSNSPSPSPFNSPSPSPTYPSMAPSPSPSPSRSVSPSPSPYSPPPDAPPKPSMKSMGGLGWYVLFLVSIFGFVVFTAYYFKGKASDLDAALPSQTRLLS